MSNSQTITFKNEDASHMAFSVPDISQEQADAVSNLLTENHKRFHIFFNDRSFHNHIAHHLVTIYGLGATPADMQKAFDGNTSYQRRLKPVDEKVTEEFTDLDTFKSNLGQGSAYGSFLAYFTSELEAHGTEKVLDKYLFARTPLADDMLGRLFAGLQHPLIHLGFALESQSVLLMAEALAMTAVHGNFLLPYFLQTEKAAADRQTGTPKTLLRMIEDAYADKSLLSHARKEGFRICEEFMTPEALPKMVALASQYRIDSSNPSPLNSVRTAVAEQMSTLAHVTTAIHRSDKKIKLDFFFIHPTNASVFLPLILESPLIKPAAIQRLVEWKARGDVLMYAHLWCPKLRPEGVRSFTPPAEHQTWDAIFRYVRSVDDDGHLPKLIRALAAGERFCKPYEKEQWCMVKGDQWRNMAALAVDSMNHGPHWIRKAGDDAAWESVPARM